MVSQAGISSGIDIEPDWEEDVSLELKEMEAIIEGSYLHQATAFSRKNS